MRRILCLILLGALGMGLLGGCGPEKKKETVSEQTAESTPEKVSQNEETPEKESTPAAQKKDAEKESAEAAQETETKQESTAAAQEADAEKKNTTAAQETETKQESTTAGQKTETEQTATAASSDTNARESEEMTEYKVIVIDAKDKTPLEGAAVQFCSDTQCMVGETDENGTAVFKAVPGDYTAHVLKAPEGYQENDKTLELTEKETTVTFSLSE